MNPRDIPEVVAELIFEMHEVRSELTAVNGKLDRLNDRVDRLEQRMEGVETEIKLLREDNRQNTDRLIEAFGKSMAPLIDGVLTHDARLNRLETPKLK